MNVEDFIDQNQNVIIESDHLHSYLGADGIR